MNVLDIDISERTRALQAAAITAGDAPSIHNTQPWHWYVHHGVADLRADLRRHLTATDPDRHMLLVSCGAALHYAVMALAAEGYAVHVDRMPDAGVPEFLARVEITTRAPISPESVRRVQAMATRHTDRRPLLDEAISDEALHALEMAVLGHGASLAILRGHDVVDLAVAIEHGQRDGLADEAVRQELSDWTIGSHPPGTGMPGNVIPAAPLQTTVASRDFGHPGTLPISEGHDIAARYAIIHGPSDEPATWLRAGEALAAIWLVATEWSVAVLPLSVGVESPSSRQELRRLIAAVGYPCLVLRLGIADASQTPTVRPPRLPGSETVDVVDE